MVCPLGSGLSLIFQLSPAGPREPATPLTNLLVKTRREGLRAAESPRLPLLSRNPIFDFGVDRVGRQPNPPERDHTSLLDLCYSWAGRGRDAPDGAARSNMMPKSAKGAAASQQCARPTVMVGIGVWRRVQPCSEDCRRRPAWASCWWRGSTRSRPMPSSWTMTTRKAKPTVRASGLGHQLLPRPQGFRRSAAHPAQSDRAKG
jgi:hypothetical protein